MNRKAISKVLIEGLLIIISVLTALFIDDYKESRQDRQNEIKYLRAIREDLVRDTVYFKYRYTDFDVMHAYGDSILDIIESKGKHQVPQRFLEKHYSTIQTFIIPFEYTLFLILLPIKFQNYPAYESMKQNGDLKLIQDFNLQMELNKHYSSSSFLDNAVNSELKRINENRRNFLTESTISYTFYIGKAKAEMYLKEAKLPNITYDSREVIGFVLGVIERKQADSKRLIKVIDEYLD